MGRLRRYRFLMVICTLTFIAVLWEVNDPSRHGQPSPLLTQRYPSEFAALYPEHEDTLHLWARSLAAQGKPEEALATLQQVIDRGIKTREAVLYDYAVLLVMTGADTARIEQAIDVWHRNYPHSPAPSPMHGRFLQRPRLQGPR